MCQVCIFETAAIEPCAEQVGDRHICLGENHIIIGREGQVGLAQAGIAEIDLVGIFVREVCLKQITARTGFA